MSLGISWSVLLAPVVAKIIEKIVDAVLKAVGDWINEGNITHGIGVLVVLMDKVDSIEQGEPTEKNKLVNELMLWATKVTDDEPDEVPA